MEHLLDILFLGTCILTIIGSLGLWIIYHRNYRFATLLFDMLPYYPVIVGTTAIMNILSFIFLEFWNNILLILGFAVLLSNFAIQFHLFRLWWSNYRLIEYKNWLQQLKEHEDVEVISIDQWVNNPIKETGKTKILIRHDVDINLTRAEQMFIIEKNLGIPSCYYFRDQAERFTFGEAKELMDKMKGVETVEIGFHYESLSKSQGDIETGVEKFHADIEAFRKYYPDLRYISAHGDRYKNRRLVRDNHLDLENLGLISSYDLDHDIYISEIGGNHHHKVNGQYVRFLDRLKLFENPSKGTLIQVLVHADWWF